MKPRERSKARKVRPLTGRQRVFVAKIVEGLSPAAAAKAAGYGGDEKHLALRAREQLARSDIKAALAEAKRTPPAASSPPTLDIQGDLKARRALFAQIAQNDQNSIRDRLHALTQLSRASGDFRGSEELKPGEGELVDWVPMLPPDATIDEYEAFCAEFRQRKIKKALDHVSAEQRRARDEAMSPDDRLRAELDAGWKDG